jgi:urate oxidase
MNEQSGGGRLRIGASSHGESRVRLLRIVRHGDRHDPRELTVSVRFEGAFDEAFREGRAEGLVPGEALKRLVHAAARDYGAAEIETFALGLCDRILGGHPRVTRARIEVVEQAWQRLDAGGKPQGRAFTLGGAESKTTAVTSNGRQIAVVSGLDDLLLMRTQGFAPAAEIDPDATDGWQRLLVGVLAARWTYTSGDVTFRPYREGVRAALIDSFSWHESRSVEHALYTMADVVLATYEEIADLTLTFHERPYRAADLFTAGLDNPEDLFVALEEPVGVVEVRVER